jgi:thiol-disulfide isomerase/thioredoxin
MKIFITLVLLLQASVAFGKVTSLTIENIFEVTDKKSIFVKFFAQWCETCQNIAGDFERVATEWRDHEIGLVAEVDCDGIDSERICDDFQITALPTIMYGDRENLELYEGDLTYKAMSEFAKEHISHPSCSIKNLEYCSEEKRRRLVELQKQ